MIVIKSCIESPSFEWRPAFEDGEIGSPTRAARIVRSLGEIGIRDLRSPASWAEAFEGRLQQDEGGLELCSQIGPANYRPFSFFNTMHRVSSAVGRVWVRNRDQGEKKRCYGTGFLIGPDLLITNNHVIRDTKDASHTTVWFGYQADEHGRERHCGAYACQELLKCSPEGKLDYSIVRLNGEPDFHYISLRRHGPKPTPNKDSVIIIQHPNGGPLKIVMEDSLVRSAWKPYIQYEADTENGSSGAPVFDFAWRIVALHHRSVMGKNQGIDIRYILDDASEVIP